MSSHPEGQEEKNKQITLRSRYMHDRIISRTQYFQFLYAHRHFWKTTKERENYVNNFVNCVKLDSTN